ncbi:multidrug transporter [Oceanicola sp. 22II-s10i]|uniref:efflux RND transporter periplasmic adaptor subunit n=1 Tax=Oceanicola sp. 22II-s10i TaxID=1317116 RepID=UPI000B52415E|nr:efflux RND transporter periplasmic adaptor subunit [Oceanicola sp. 22II-s10i]OWU83739.1 multidrug transporter [Oceanicola sp. 22II-s10i]
MWLKWIRSILSQLILAAIVLGGTLAIWIAYVPAAHGWLERAGVYDLLGVEPATAAEGQAPAARGGREVRVVAADVGTGTLNDRISAIGDGRAIRSVAVKAEASGSIIEIGAEAGHQVEAGQVIFRLDAEAERIALDRAQLMLADARDNADRLDRLRQSGAATAVALRDAELQLRTAELAVRQAEFDLAQREIVAPIGGWVGLLEIEIGDRITNQDTLAVITDRSEIQIDFRVPERVLAKLSTGMKLTAVPLALNGVTLEGEVAAIDNRIDRNSRTIRVLGRLSNEGDRLRDGMALSVTLAFPGETYPSVDPLAVQWSSEGPFVWIVREDKAVRVNIEIRQRNADRVLVSGKLEPGEKVVIEGVQTLRPGAAVSLAEQAAALNLSRGSSAQTL